VRSHLPKAPLLVALALTVAGVAPSFGQSEALERGPQPSGCTFDVSQFGRTPHTSPELIRLQSRLIDPAIPVTRQLILELNTAAGRDVSSTPAATNGSGAGRSKAKTRALNQEDSAGKYLDILVYALPQKQGEALAESLSTVTEDQFLRIRPMQPATQQCLQETVVKLLPLLSFEEEWGILFRGEYALFKSEALASYLQLLYETLENHLVEDPDFDRERQLRSYRSGILKRIYEADPGRGRDIILKEIASEQPRSDIEALRILPDDTLPAMDPVFAKQLPAAYENADWAEYNAKLGVIERYATSSILADMKSIYLNDPQERNQYHEFLFFSYFLRTDPPFGRQLVETSLRVPQSNCSNVLFTELAGIRSQPELREIARQHLGDPNKCVAANAAYSFKHMGNQGVEALLWQYLEAWHKEWAGRSEPIPFPEQEYEDGLVEALLFGRGPCESRDTVERLKHFYIKGNSVDGNIAFPVWHDPVRIMVEPHHFQNPTFLVDSCSGSLSVEQVLAAIQEYPGRTEFEWYGPSDSTLESLIAPVRLEIERALKQHNMSFHFHAEN
jgi:hypothetical protein